MSKSDDSHGSGGGDPATTSFCWTYGGKEGREVFNLETTISGTLGEAEIENHIASAIRAMGAVFRHGGRARWSGAEANRSAKTAASPAPGSRYEWGRSRTGKSVLLIHKDAVEPDEIECPIHGGKTMKRRTNESGSWMSHNEGDTYCTARIQVLMSDE